MATLALGAGDGVLYTPGASAERISDETGEYRVLSARLQLREGTRRDHDQVDAAYAGFDLSTTRGYGEFLSAQARAFLPMEAAVERAGAALLFDDWDARRRGDLLRADLAELGLAPADLLEAPAFPSAAAVLGAVYVLEGSRLGGAVLRRAIPPGAPMRFLGGDEHGPRWRALTQLLDERLTGAPDLDAAVAAARSVFQRFHDAAQMRVAA